MTYCIPILLGISRHHVEKFQNIQDKAHNLCGGKKINKWSSVDETIKRNALLMVFGCLHCAQPEIYDSYFRRISHCKATRGNNSLLKLLHVKTESGRKSFKYQGALIYNALSADVRDE